VTENSQLIRVGGPASPSIFTIRPEARTRLCDLSARTSAIRILAALSGGSPAVRQFSRFCAEHRIADLAQVEPIHVAAFNVANSQNVTSLVTTAYNLTVPTTANATGILTYQPHIATGGFDYQNSVNSNFAYSPPNIQAGARLFF